MQTQPRRAQITAQTNRRRPLDQCQVSCSADSGRRQSGHCFANRPTLSGGRRDQRRSMKRVRPAAASGVACGSSALDRSCSPWRRCAVAPLRRYDARAASDEQREARRAINPAPDCFLQTSNNNDNNSRPEAEATASSGSAACSLRANLWARSPCKQLREPNKTRRSLGQVARDSPSARSRIAQRNRRRRRRRRLHLQSDAAPR